MNPFKCGCGCDGLDKDQLKELIDSMDRASSFLNNDLAVEIFRNRICPNRGESAYEPQASGSQHQYITPKSKYVKYLENIDNAKWFTSHPEEFSKVREGWFWLQIDEKWKDDIEAELEAEKMDEQKIKAIMCDIIDEYGKRITESKEYKEVRMALIEKYEKKFAAKK